MVALLSERQHPIFNRRQAIALIGGSAALAGSIRPSWASNEKVLRIGHPSLDLDWSPLRGGGPPYRWNALWWAAPMLFDGRNALNPYLFTDWSSNPDWTSWTFKVNVAASFSDGSRITAAEVKNSWELAALPATRNQRIDQVLTGVLGFADMKAGVTTSLEGVVVVNDVTLSVMLARPDPMFDRKIANHLAPIVPPGARGGDGLEREGWWRPETGLPVSGPFRPVKMYPERGRIVMERNPRFFGPTPKLDRIEIIHVPDDAMAIAMLRNGELDAHTDIASPTILDDLGPEFSAGPAIPKGQHFWLNVSKAPTHDIKVRQALILAVDRDALFRATYPQGPHHKADQLLNAVTGADPNFKSYPFNPDAARRALAESSYGSPVPLPVIEIAGASNSVNARAAEFIMAQWHEHLGISRVRLGPQIDRAAEEQGHTVQIFRDDVGTRVPDAILYLNSAIQSGSTNALEKLGGYINPAVDAALSQGAALAPDNPGRDFLARSAMKLFHEDWAVIYWCHETMPRNAMARVVGMEKNADWQVIRPWDIDVAPSP